MSQRLLMRAKKGPFDVFSPEDTLDRNTIGSNSGNLLFSHAIHRMLLTKGSEITSNQFRHVPDEADRINEEYDAFVVPLANAFRPDFMRFLEPLTKLIERLTIPVTVFGVGAQTSLDYDLEEMRPLNDQVKAFARAVLDRGPSIGVRGELTKDYLNHLGFSDVEIIGCPSLFLHGRDFHIEKKVPELTTESKLAITISPLVTEMGEITRSHLRKYPNLTYISQDLEDLRSLIFGDKLEEAGMSNGLPFYTSHELYQQNKIRFFADPWTWMDYLSDHDFTFGTRIHGDVASLLAGTPTMVLAHDSRTLELARFLNIPHKKISELGPDVDAAELYAEADFTALNKGYPALLDNLIAFMDKHGLEHVFAEGQSTEEFDRRLAETRFPQPAQALTSQDPNEIGRRLAWMRQKDRELHRRTITVEKKVTGLTSGSDSVPNLRKEVQRLQKRSDSLEREIQRLKRTPYWQLRRLAGRAVRKVRRTVAQRRA